jgi:hypothetical protein
MSGKGSKAKRKRKLRKLARAARFLEEEAREYLLDAKYDNDSDERYCGMRAKLLLGYARFIRQVVLDGNI